MALCAPLRIACCLGILIGCNAAAAVTDSISIFYAAGEYTAKPGRISGALAYGTFDPVAANETGWGRLWIEATSAETSAYTAAGLAEGMLTCEFVAAVANNNDDTRQNAQVLNFTKAAEEWTRTQAAHNSSEFWTVISQILAQFDGLVEGYRRSHCSASTPLTRTQLWLMQMDGDLEDVKVKFPGTIDARIASTPRPQHCSSLVKLAADHSDLYFGHATWDIYSNAAPRIFKTYNLVVKRGGHELGHTTHFSSTGPWLSSVDDFYTVSGTADLGVMETSNTVINTSLYESVRPESLLCWIRVIAANRLATDGAHWAELFSMHHSGTYTNQWQIVDLSKFKPGELPRPGVLTVLEEVPGLIRFEDMTEHLNSKYYWPSYNVPYFDDIRARNGDSDGSWSLAPRAKLFTMLQESVVSIPTMQHVMRWNDYLTTPKISGGDPCHAIACRADIRSPGSHPLSAFGAIDAKLSSYRTYYSMNQSMTVYANAGPTHDEQPVFCWSSSAFTDPHNLHPDCFKYNWTSISTQI